MEKVERRPFVLSILLGIALTAVQASLLLVLIVGYAKVTNRRIGAVSLSSEAALIAAELDARRPWPEIERRLRERHGPVSDDDEMAVYDDQGRLLVRSGSDRTHVPAALAPELRARIGDGIAVLDSPEFGVVGVAGRRVIGGQPLYLLRVNLVVRNLGTRIVWLAMVALVLPMLLLSIAGAAVMVRVMGRQVHKVDRVLRVMAGGDLSARMSLPVDADTAGVVLSFNRMADKVERTVEKLRRSDEARRQLLADVTHELNTPLTSVLGYLETLTMDDLPLSPEKRHELTTIAHEEALNLRGLIEDLTTLSRLDAEGLPIERYRIDLGEVVERVARGRRHSAESRGVPLRTEIEPGVEVMGDAARIGQVVRNLVENALRHTSPPGDVTVIVRSDPEGAVLEVVDRGTGISAEDLAKLGQQRFLRLDRSRARRTGGRGLGLSISTGLVEMHGGALRFESEVGHGTTARVTLPLAPADDTLKEATGRHHLPDGAWAFEEADRRDQAQAEADDPVEPPGPRFRE